MFTADAFFVFFSSSCLLMMCVQKKSISKIAFLSLISQDFLLRGLPIISRVFKHPFCNHSFSLFERCCNIDYLRESFLQQDSLCRHRLSFLSSSRLSCRFYDVFSPFCCCITSFLLNQLLLFFPFTQPVMWTTICYPDSRCCCRCCWNSHLSPLIS